MIHISEFDTEFKGRKVKDEKGTVYTLVGYGDSQNAPYLVGLNDDNGRVVLRSVLIKNAEFVP